MSLDLTGHLLIAVPEMDDDNFSRAVVLLIHYSTEEGAMGVILNRPLDLAVEEVWKNVSDTPVKLEQPANWGGPVHGPLVVLHRQQQYADLMVVPNLYVTTAREKVEAIVCNHQQLDGPFRIFLGYSGWGQGQLENEAEHGGWFVLPPDGDIAFSDPNTMWKHCCCQVANQVLHSDQRLQNFMGNKPEQN